jgi:hypothetical protein
MQYALIFYDLQLILAPMGVDPGGSHSNGRTNNAPLEAVAPSVIGGFFTVVRVAKIISF